MSTATLTPPNLAALMAGAVKAPPKAKSSTPCVNIDTIAAVTAEYPKLCADLKAAEARKAAAAAIIMAAATPDLRALSVAKGAPASGIRVNGLLFMRNPSQSILQDTEEAPGAVAHAMNNFGADFERFFAPVVTSHTSPAGIMAINAYLDSVQAPCPRIEYSVRWKPTAALHAARTLDENVENLCRVAVPHINPVCYVNAK